MTMKTGIDDPRLLAPQSTSLILVEIIHENQWVTVRRRGGFFANRIPVPTVIILPIVNNISGT